MLYNFEESMGSTFAEFYNLPLSIQKNIRTKFNEMCENNDGGLVMIKSIVQYNKEPNVNDERRMRKVCATEQHIKTSNIEDEVMLPYSPNHCYFINKPKNDISEFNIKFGNLPEYTLLELTQAKYIHYTNTFVKGCE